MTFQNLWPLFLLIFIPVIILLYILKQKARDEKFSSSMLWQEIYKNLEARTPFEKLKHNILMYIQILIMLVFIFSLMAPMLKKGGKSKENIVLVMDYSASMSFEYEAGETRLEESISEASALLDKSDEDAVITIITCDGTAQLIYQGANNANAINSLKEIDPQNTAGTLDDAAATVNSIITGMTNVKVICYTDTDFDSEALIQNNDQASVTVHSVYSQGIISTTI
jgi:hypothetical protein